MIGTATKGDCGGSFDGLYAGWDGPDGPTPERLPDMYACGGSLPLLLNACGSAAFLNGCCGSVAVLKVSLGATTPEDAPPGPLNWLICRLRKDSMGEPGVSSFSGVLGGNACTTCGS